MTENKNYCFVVDKTGNQLSPTKENKGWYLIRKGKAKLINKYPMVIQLNKDVSNIDKSQVVVGIDDGSKYVGVAVVQECKTKNKVVFKGTIQLRQDISKKMDTRRDQRRYRRNHKRYRQARFNNRSSSRRNDRIAPSIKQKKDSVLRVVNRLNKYIYINSIILEDVAIDIRAIQEGRKLYRWQYQKSNRLDENIRKATIFRDNCKCMECGKSDCILEVHHIVPRRLKGNNTLGNLITLCSDCHDKTKGKEEQFITKYQSMINGKNLRFDYAQHVMQGKSYLRKELFKFAPLELTDGGTTANRRIDWGINKTHSNDAIVICGLEVNSNDCDISDLAIKPLRKKVKSDKELNGFKCRDIVKYTKKNGDVYVGYIISLDIKKKTFSFTDFFGKTYRRYGISRCKLLFRPNGLMIYL